MENPEIGFSEKVAGQDQRPRSKDGGRSLLGEC